MGQQELGRFAGAAVIVTGGGHGIGRASAVRLAEEGAHIAVADLDQTAAQQVAAGLTQRDRRHVAVWLDVTDVSSVERAFADAVSGLGGIDVLINVAGGDTYHGTFEETTDEVWVSMIELNLLGVVRCCRAAIPHLRRSANSPAIVNISSVNALAALGSEPYSSAKAGIGALTINLCGQSGCRWHPSEHCRAGHHQDPKLGWTRGRRRSLPPPLSAGTRRGTRGRRCCSRLSCVQRRCLDHRAHTPCRRRTLDRRPT
jgi:NAD(P)-dependent dehydrogenase (short-subunit alcohol dehydrogenase family)